MKNIRIERLQKELLHLTASIFQGDINDSRLSGIEITQTKLSPDFSHLKLYFTNINTGADIKETIELLKKSSGYIKKKIAGANIMRSLPQIVFEYDNTNERVEKINKLFSIIAEEKRNQNYYEDDSDNDFYDDNDEILEEDLEDYDDYNDEIDKELEYDYEEDDDDEIEEVDQDIDND
jgi:ribosome-binding factor A